MFHRSSSAEGLAPIRASSFTHLSSQQHTFVAIGHRGHTPCTPSHEEQSSSSLVASGMPLYCDRRAIGGIMNLHPFSQLRCCIPNRSVTRHTVATMRAAVVIVLGLASAIASTSAQITCGDRLIFKRQCQAFVNSEPPLVTYAAQATKDLCQQQCEASINDGSAGRCCQFNKVRCKRAPLVHVHD